MAAARVTRVSPRHAAPFLANAAIALLPLAIRLHCACARCRQITMLTVLVINSALAVDVSWPSSCAGQTGYDTSYPSLCPCTASGTFEVPAGVTTIPSNAFGHCTGITSVTGMSDVTTIDEAAFAYSGVQSIHWPSGATEIPKKAFDEAKSLSKITGLDVVSSVGGWAFYDASVQPAGR